MTAKDKYGLQCKLASAMTRVLEVLQKFENAGLMLNPANLFFAAGIADALGRIAADNFENSQTTVKLTELVGPAGLTAAIGAIQKRRKESKKRRKRRNRLASRAGSKP